ncbi:unnamed protein product [[Actinomadura] parvosata subsp. kistnae]|nr:unnamed protein product [Actinomadura parvosata subsp. kistnae]
MLGERQFQANQLFFRGKVRVVLEGHVVLRAGEGARKSRVGDLPASVR